MQAFRNTRRRFGKLVGICGVVVLALSIMVPTAAATSIIAQGETEDEEQTASPASPAGTLSSAQIQFLEDNWAYTIEDPVIEQAPTEPGVAEVASVLEDIQFLEANWYFAPGDADRTSGGDETTVPMSLEDMLFLEMNTDLGLS